MALLYNPTITTAGTTTSGTFKLREMSGPVGVGTLAVFTYGTSGGTSVNVYLQTSFDQSVWTDVIAFNQFTTSSARDAGSVSTVSGQATTNGATTGDGTLTAGHIVPGLLGTWWRVKVVSVGTYVGATTVAVYATGMIAGT